jgi:hypothetical protein
MYEVNFSQEADLKKRFTHHPPKYDQVERYILLRDSAHELATLILKYTPVSQEQSLAITKLEEVVMWANAAIARNET